MSDPTIPFGYKRLAPDEIWERGDGVWNGCEFVRCNGRNKERATVSFGNIVIRRCEAQQPELISGDPLNFD